ncbi:MAG: hypothetical protein ABIA04_06075 [Pseudomonadota bacterium]
MNFKLILFFIIFLFFFTVCGNNSEDTGTTNATDSQDDNLVLLTISVNPPGAGIISPSIGSYELETESLQSLSATANPGYIFSNWTAAGSATISSTQAATTTITLFSDTVVTASFTELP